MAEAVGLIPDDLNRTSEQQLWFAVLVQGLHDCLDGKHWPREEFETVCDLAGCDARAVLRHFRDKTGL